MAVLRSHFLPQAALQIVHAIQNLTPTRSSSLGTTSNLRTALHAAIMRFQKALFGV